MRILAAIALWACATIAQAVCPAGVTCVSWRGAGVYSDEKVIPATYIVTYYLYKGPTGGPYTKIGAYTGTPTGAFHIQVPKAVAPLLCFVATATTDAPDDKGVLTQKISPVSSEGCAKGLPPAPTNGSIVAPTDGSVVH